MTYSARSPRARRAAAFSTTFFLAGLAVAAPLFTAHCADSSDASSDKGGDTAPLPGPDSSASEAQGEDGPPTLLVAHASPSLPDVRLCFARQDRPDGPKTLLDAPAFPHASASPMPQANYPGVPVGGALAMPEVLTFDAAPYLVPYAIDASAVLNDVDTNPNERRCPQMICTRTGCLGAAQYVELPAIDTRELGEANTLLALVGCRDGETDPARCGGDGKGGAAPLRLVPLRLPAPTATAGSLTVHLAQLAPGLAVTDVHARAGGDAVGQVSREIQYLEIATDSPLTIPLPQSISGYGTTTLGVTYRTSAELDGGAETDFGSTLELVQRLSSPLDLPDEYFERPSAFVLLLVGDPAPSVPQLHAEDGGLNRDFTGRGLHFVALPIAKAEQSSP